MTQLTQTWLCLNYASNASREDEEYFETGTRHVSSIKFVVLFLTADCWKLYQKWFAFSKMDIGVGEMLRKLDGMG
jgi:hypothetical protein